MNTLSLDQVKQIEVNILTYIDRVCKENDIPYYLDAGTLLGAVRHKGFIPWDDDIDIVVPAEYYRRLLELLDRNNQYTVFSIQNHTDYPYYFSKCCDAGTRIIEKNVTPIEGLGIYVDIYPMMYSPKGAVRSSLFIRWISLLKNISWQGAVAEFGGAAPRSIKGRIARGISRLFSWRKVDSYMKSIGSKHTDSQVFIIEKSGRFTACRRSYFDEPSAIFFEGMDFNAPSHPDDVLRIEFENYMQLPPEEERVLKHNFEAYSL